jgi:hypothetical protein
MSTAISRETTEVSVEKTLYEIQRLLGEHGAQAVLVEYDAEKRPDAISFRIRTREGLWSYRLPAGIKAVTQVREQGRKQRIRNRKEFDNQSARISWRIIRDWLEAQLAMDKAGLVDMAQIFLPYAQDVSGITLYERLKEQKFSGLLQLPESGDKEPKA